jgi:hypothetical protein
MMTVYEYCKTQEQRDAVSEYIAAGEALLAAERAGYCLPGARIRWKLAKGSLRAAQNG